MIPDLEQAVQRILAHDSSAAGDLVSDVISWPVDRRDELVAALMPEPAGRRWLRGALLSALAQDDASGLAGRLISFEDDFDPRHRDSTTAQVVRSLPLDKLLASTTFFAGSNAASPFWIRVAAERADLLPGLALDVLGSTDASARETMLHLLLLDPYSDVQLTGPDRLTVLSQALQDPHGEVRGIAADLLTDENPERLLLAGAQLRLDSNERVRMAVWDAAFQVDFEGARDAAFQLALDESAPIEPRRTAVAALSAVLTTDEIAPLLEMLVAHPNRVLADDAVNILWTYHRAPAIATAASESPHESVRAVAQRLLHPETGSPAAGGSRPGAPDVPRDIYQEMLKGYERRRDV